LHRGKKAWRVTAVSTAKIIEGAQPPNIHIMSPTPPGPPVEYTARREDVARKTKAQRVREERITPFQFGWRQAMKPERPKQRTYRAINWKSSTVANIDKRDGGHKRTFRFRCLPQEAGPMCQ
jgi:hypothetical protein